MDEQINDIFVWAFFGPGIATAFLVVAQPGTRLRGDFPIHMILIFATVAVVFSFLVWRLIRLIKRRRAYRLGFAGERAVAEELNQLMLEGCHVFHDVPMDPYGNIDHVVVAPTGIYAVETKTRRKRKTPDGQRDYEVVFDGKTLLFPGYTDSRSLQQARHQADRLCVFLTAAVGEPVKVGAILTLPGWFVTSRVRENIKVLNPKGIRTAVLVNRSPDLPKQLFDRVVHQLDRKCRDVEF